VNVNLNPKNGKVMANEHEQSSAGHIFAIGDILDGKPELTPVAIQVHPSFILCFSIHFAIREKPYYDCDII